MSHRFLRAFVFEFVLFSCLAFAFLTAAAMAFYRGGTLADHHSRGYSFLVNFFSDLGRTRAYSGAPNTVAAPLFALALVLAGLALASFFVAFAGFFQSDPVSRIGALFAATLGILAGAYFIGVALTPANLNSRLHVSYVLAAFRSFLLAVLPFAVLIWKHPRYPRFGAWIFLAFALFLLAYLALMSFGPVPGSPGGLIIQVTGQKLIVYTSLGCVAAQSIVARRFLRNEKA